jgi:hypothetical protein
VHYHGFIVMQFALVTVQNVLLSSRCLIVCSFMSFIRCYVAINCFKCFSFSFYVCCLGLYALRVLCFDVITSLVSLVYWGFRCEKVKSQGESYSNVA